MRVSYLLTACVLLVGLGIAAPALADVPDARLVVADVTVTPAEPAPGNTTTVEFTVENSAGSTTGVTVDRIALQDRDRFANTHADAEDLGSLSVGDDVTLELANAFSESGVKELELLVETTDETGNGVTITRPVTVVVGGVDAAGVTDDVQIDARTVHPSELDDDEELDVDLGPDAGDLLGGDDDSETELRTPLVRVEVTNFGTATARDTVVSPSREAGTLPRLPAGDIPPGESESVLFDAGDFDEQTTLSFEAGYVLGDQRNTSETTLEYRPNRGEIVLTDVDMALEDGAVTVTGNAANPGLGEVNGAIVAVGSTEHVAPTYPAREYFVGTVPESEFVRFDVTADVDHANATTVPVSVTYLADGDPYERTVELPYDARVEADGDGDASGIPTLAFVAAAAASMTLLGAAALSWRRLRDRD